MMESDPHRQHNCRSTRRQLRLQHNCRSKRRQLRLLAGKFGKTYFMLWLRDTAVVAGTSMRCNVSACSTRKCAIVSTDCNLWLGVHEPTRGCAEKIQVAKYFKNANRNKKVARRFTDQNGFDFHLLDLPFKGWFNVCQYWVSIVYTAMVLHLKRMRHGRPVCFDV